MYIVSLHIKLSCLMLAHTAKQAIHLLNSGKTTDVGTVEKHIFVLQCVRTGTESMHFVSANNNSEELSEVAFRFSLIMQLMEFDINLALSEHEIAESVRW